MTLTGLVLIVVGAAVALTAPIAYNGQWLLGLLLALVGLGLAWHDRKGGPRDGTRS